MRLLFAQEVRVDVLECVASLREGSRARAMTVGEGESRGREKSGNFVYWCISP